LDCGDVTHGCFRGIDACAASAAAGAASGDNSAANTSQGNNADLDELLNKLASQTSTTTTAEEAKHPTSNFNTSPMASPSVPSVHVNSNPSQVAEEANKPTESPTLPPWTNAPFVPYKGGKRDKTVIGYYASWQWYDRNKFADPKNVDFSKYDRINYAFFQPDKQGRIYGTDEWADPQLLWGDYDYASPQITSGPDRNYFCSWDGPSPSQHNCATHKGDGILDRAKAVGVQVMPSIGGWTLSDNFPTIAASEELRREFAKNCVRLIEEYGFDGIDIDWEYPAYEDHSGTPADTVNYTYFLQAIRDALDKLGQAKGRYFPLTAALPCGPDKIEKIQVDKIKDILDELNLMSYDLHGAWDVLTGTNAPMFDQGWTDQSKRWSVHGCTENYLERGVDLAKINLGLPFYGRSFRKATGFKQVHEGPDDINYHLDEGSPQYFNIVKALGRMTTYRHEKTQTQYAVFDDTGGLVSYDDARAICDKVHYANQRGMHGFLVWEISGDMLDNGETPLIDATNAKIDNPNLDCSKLRDPLWALSDSTYHYAPPEPEKVDWTSVNPLNLAAPMGYSNGNAVPIPAPTPNSPTSNDSPSLNSNTVGIPSNSQSNASPSASSTQKKSDDCPPEHTGYWASSDCTQYMYCQAGAVVGALMPCVPGTLFDVTTATCAFAANVPSCSR
jgi:chitinase